MLIDKLIELLRSDDVKKVLESIRSGKDINISTKFSTRVDLSHTVGSLSISESEKVIDLLSKLDIIKEARYANTVRCPYCGSLNIKETFKCPECGSTNIKKVYILQHLKCGKSFSSDKLLVDRCPACKDDITSIKEIRLVGGLFKCNKCGAMFETPNITYTCSDCGSQFGIREADVGTLYKYKLSDEGIRILDDLGKFKTILDKLGERGYDVESPGKISGKSGVEHVFPIVVRSRAHNSVYTVDLTGFFEDIDETYLLKNYIKIIDIPEAKHIFVINSSPANKKINVPPGENIIILYVSNIDEAADKLIDIMAKEVI